MDAARWERIQTLFHEALERPAPERRAFLEAASGGDAGLAAEVLRMLEEDARAAPLLDADVARVAGSVLDAEAPRRLGPYRLRQRLGEGGMGVVYLAEREDLGNLVAIKVLRDAWVSPSRRERFAAEQRTLAQLEHPLIARLYDADALPDGTPWFAMEYVDGVPLTEYCRRRATSIPERLQLFHGVCEAVQHAHRHAVIHRDLKPSNVLVKEDGGVRLLDFGIAKQLESLDAPADQTRTGLRLMTPAYAAPEQLRGEPVGIHTDVYSLGVILYELLTGQLPAADERPSLAIRRLAAALPAGRAAPLAGRESWADLDVLCLTAMHQDPGRRYGSVEALMRDLDRYARNEPLEARPDTFRYRARKFVARQRNAVLAAAGVALVVVALVAFYTARLTRARNAALAEAARTQRIQRFMLDLFEGGDSGAGPAEDLRVVTLVERGLQAARALDAEPAVQAETYMTLGGVYEKLGDLRKAETLLQAAVDRRRELHGAEHPALAESLVALGLLRSSQARLDEAEALVAEGLAIARRTLPPGHPTLGRATAARGRLLQERGDYAGAIAELEQAVRLLSSEDAPEADLADALTDLANVHFYAGDYEESEALNLRALDIDRRLYGERHPNLADGLINLGAIRLQLGRYAEAEEFDRRALRILEAWYGPDHPETASALTLLARALVYQNRHADAEALLERALAIQEGVYGPLHPRVASALNELGNVAYARDDHDAAEARFRRMADIYREAYPGGHFLVGTALSNLGSVHLARGEPARAEQLYREAIAIYAATLPRDSLNVGIARIKLGRSLLRQGRHAEAERESLAGYEALARQTDPSVSWLQSAREDLVAEYEALERPQEAAKYRAELSRPAVAATGD
jgi:serine/threonine-protein kinase